MPTPGFPPPTLDDEGLPSWISALASDGADHTVHVVRDLEPVDALTVLGANPELFRVAELPANKPDEWTSLPAAALGASATLLAGRVGGWTFVYDDTGATSHDDTKALSVAGRVAATSMLSSSADASLTYAVDGDRLAWLNVDDLDLATDLPDLPTELGAAFAAAGTVEHDYLDPGEPDYAICMRVVCALAGLYLTAGDVRQLPLLVTPFG